MIALLLQRPLLAALSLACLAGLGEAQSTPWRSSWLGVPLAVEECPANQWLCYRGTLELEAPPEHVRARIAVDSRYWLWVNGELVVYEGGLKRGPTPRDTYFDELDLGPSLREGENTFAVLVWYFGKQGFSHNDSGRAGLCFELDAPGEPRWRARRHPAYGDPVPFGPFPNYRLPESDVRYDAREALDGWTSIDFDDRDWPAPLDLGRPPCAPWNELVRRPTPQLRDLGVHAYVELRREPLEDGGQLVRGVLPVNTTIHPRLEVEAPAGLTIDIRTDNYRGGGERNLRHQYVTREGVQEYEALSYLSGEEVHYQIPAGVEVLGLTYRETRYDSDVVGSFECDDELLMLVRQKALDTLPLNLRDGIQDPDRERAQWWDDVVNVIPQLAVTYDERARALVAKAIRNLVDWQKEDGILYSPIPSGTWDRELPLQMLAAVGELGVARQIRYSADLELLREVEPRLRRYLELWHTGEDGLVVPRPGGWTWLDWGENKDAPLLYDAWYHLALRGARDMAGWLGERERVAALEGQLARHRRAVREAYWSGTEFRSAQHEGPPDDRGNALAVLAGLSEPEDAAQLESLLLRERHASPYMERFVLEALFELGDGTSALDRLRTRYAAMAADASSTLWERWDLDPRRSSRNHAWSGSPLSLCAEQVAGISPLTPGYEALRVRPRLGDLSEVRAILPTVHGLVSLELHRDEASLELRCSIPPGSSAQVELPPPLSGSWAVVAIDGAEVWRRSESALSPPTFSLTAGAHQLRAQR